MTDERDDISSLYPVPEQRQRHDWRRLERPDDFRQARRALGLTQAELAEALELEGGDAAKDKVRFIESGKRPATGPIRVAIRFMLERAGLL